MEYLASIIAFFSFSPENHLGAKKKIPEKKQTGFLPIEKPELIDYYYKQRDMFWVPSDIDLSADLADIPTLMKEVYELVVGLLAFFVPADNAINDNLMSNFQEDVSKFYKEAGAMYTIQAAIETIHSETYSNFADILIKNKKDRDRIFNPTESYQSLNKLFKLMNEYMDRSKPLMIRILFFACIEGVIFNTAFTIIYWFKKQNILPGFCKGNEWIGRDEALHTRFAVALMINLFNDGYFDLPTRDEMINVISECVKINEEFNKEILPNDITGLSCGDLNKYTRCTADALLKSFDYEPHYKHENPFTWMAVISLPNKTNFFEQKTSEYAKSEGKRIFLIKDVY